jgi:uncharacterized protein YjbI with pentapeptide repeats
MIAPLVRLVMKILGKPQNRYGWVRMTAWVALAGVLAWSLTAAALRAVGEVSWMTWSGYQTFALLKGLELALVPLLAALLAGWLEDLEHRHHIALTRHREAQRTRAAQREAAVRRFQAAVQELLPEAEPEREAVPLDVRVKLAVLVREALSELDGRGKGEALRFLCERRLITGDQPVVELRGADCRGVVLNAASLAGICLEWVNLVNAQFDDAQLAQARFAGANLSGALLRQADLRGAGLRGSHLDETHLDGANLEGADCSPTSLDQAILIDTIDPEGRKVTNENGRQHLRDKEYAIVVERL